VVLQPQGSFAQTAIRCIAHAPLIALGFARLAQEPEGASSRLIKTSDRISERLPRGGLSVSFFEDRFWHKAHNSAAPVFDRFRG
jgi:hypothetical protein